MGAANTTVQNQYLEDSLRNELESKGYATTDCSAVQKNILIFDSIDGCNISIENKCIADSTVDSESMADAMRNVIQSVATDQKASGIAILNANTSVTDTKTVVERINEIQQECESKSVVELEQDNELYPGECTGSNYTLLQGGNAQASCMLKLVQQDFFSVDNDQETTQIIEGFDFVTSGMTSLIPLIICIMCVSGGFALGAGDNMNTPTQMPIRIPRVNMSTMRYPRR